MDKTRQQPSFTKEQATRYLKGLLRAAEIETDKKEKARSEIGKDESGSIPKPPG